MSTSTLLRVEGTAWSVANKIEEGLAGKTNSEDIVRSLGLDYTVSAHNMKTDIEEPVQGYWAMYRDDTNKFLGPVKSANPIVTQNVDAFKPFEPLMEDGTLKPLVADSYLDGQQLFGCFELNNSFKVLDDQFKQYFIVLNNHLKPDGNLTIINTPVRIACLNAMSAALGRANLKFKVPAAIPEGDATIISTSIMNAFNRTVKKLQSEADRLVNTKISRKGIDTILDELFPFIEETEEQTTNHTRANQAVEAQREAFTHCLNESNLANYQGTAYQIFNALTDYTTHYFRTPEKGFDLEHRMTLLPGMNPEATTESLKVTKFLNNLDKFEAIA